MIGQDVPADARAWEDGYPGPPNPCALKRLSHSRAVPGPTPNSATIARTHPPWRACQTIRARSTALDDLVDAGQPAPQRLGQGWRLLRLGGRGVVEYSACRL